MVSSGSSSSLASFGINDSALHVKVEFIWAEGSGSLKADLCFENIHSEQYL